MNRSLKNTETNSVETGLRPVSIIILLLTATFIYSCSKDHLINNKQYLAGTESAFNKRRILADKRDTELFSVFKLNLSLKQTEALEFLFAYMPLSDLADYNGKFFLDNADISLRTRSEAKWGKDIPEEIFLHYVLPFRINNENLDSFRIAYYSELMNRVKGKDITDAALEINHWCHEKVCYQPSDDRTSAPMSTILSARGRCGEESTFTVAALRTVGIPARQVYTPRWAHTDDNHAWVEIWVQGNWYYMGACEPEPVIDLGWFTEPARRAMLVHTKSFGACLGNENAVNSFRNYTDVNNLAKYAVTKKLTVKILDRNLVPVENALVEYQLYNYAEFYPLAVVPTDKSGISQFETGLGDLLIWAHKGDDYNFRKISVAETDTLILRLDRKDLPGSRIDLDLDVPVVRSPLPGPRKELTDINSERINRENIIRQAYTDTWMKAAEAKALAIKINIDSTRIMSIIARSMGNYGEIRSFLSETPDSLRPFAVSMLEFLPDKDLRDARCSVLADHLMSTSFPVKFSGDSEAKLFKEYILNPRIANEMLTPYRHYFLTKLPSELLNSGPKNPLFIVQYLNDKIKIADDENYYNTPITPIGVNELKVSDAGSRAICFVAICRSLGIPSRLEPGRNVPQYFLNNKWNDVYFSGQVKPGQDKGYLKLYSSDAKPVPEYYIHFTLARFEGGRYNTIEYDYNKKVSDFREELPLPPGHYMLVTGNRLASGRILSAISFFNLAGNEHKTIEVKIRKDVSEKKILAKIDLKKFYTLSSMNSSSQVCTNDKGLVIIWIEPEKEPTKHIFSDLPSLKNEFDQWGGKFLFLTGENDAVLAAQNDANSSGTGYIKGLPANTSFGTDKQLALLKNSFNLQTELNLPVVIVSDKNGNVFFISEGYRIGIGEQILKYVR